MTEITAKIDWVKLTLAITLAPLLANTVALIASALYPPALLVGMFMLIGSLVVGYTSYLILGTPLMVLAQALGLRHPLIHGAIGFGAVWLIPAAHSAGLPYIARPDAVELGVWFAPLWCAVAAYSYNLLSREFDLSERALS